MYTIQWSLERSLSLTIASERQGIVFPVHLRRASTVPNTTLSASVLLCQSKDSPPRKALYVGISRYCFGGWGQCLEECFKKLKRNIFLKTRRVKDVGMELEICEECVQSAVPTSRSYLRGLPAHRAFVLPCYQFLRVPSIVGGPLLGCSQTALVCPKRRRGLVK